MTRNQKVRMKRPKLIKIRQDKLKSKIRKERITRGKPQRKGIIIKLYTMTPKKPNSALRKVAKVKVGKYILIAYIPGENNKLSIHNVVLIQPGKIQDLPGVKYRIISKPSS